MTLCPAWTMMRGRTVSSPDTISPGSGQCSIVIVSWCVILSIVRTVLTCSWWRGMVIFICHMMMMMTRRSITEYLISTRYSYILLPYYPMIVVSNVNIELILCTTYATGTLTCFCSMTGLSPAVARNCSMDSLQTAGR